MGGSLLRNPRLCTLQAARSRNYENHGNAVGEGTNGVVYKAELRRGLQSSVPCISACELGWRSSIKVWLGSASSCKVLPAHARRKVSLHVEFQECGSCFEGAYSERARTFSAN